LKNGWKGNFSGKKWVEGQPGDQQAKADQQRGFSGANGDIREDVSVFAGGDGWLKERRGKGQVPKDKEKKRKVYGAPSTGGPPESVQRGGGQSGTLHTEGDWEGDWEMRVKAFIWGGKEPEGAGERGTKATMQYLKASERGERSKPKE